MSFTWPRDDVSTLRSAYRDARRVYRAPSPGSLNLTMSAFTETAYRVARLRMHLWRDLVPTQSAAAKPALRENLAVTWSANLAQQVDDDWDAIAQHAEDAHEAAMSGRLDGYVPRPRVLKADVARAGILSGLDDWPAWVPSCPNDHRRAVR